MSQVSKNEKYYRDLVTDFERCLGEPDLDAAFQRVKEYIFKNFSQNDAARKNQEVIHHQSSFSRVKQDKRLGQIGYSEYNQEVNKITRSIQEFVQTLKPEGVVIENLRFISNEAIKEIWNYENNMVASLVFHDGFGLLSSVFFAFKEYCKKKTIVRVDRYFFNGTIKITVDETRFSSLEETELKEVVTESMDWPDAIIIQKKDKNGYPLAEGFILQHQENEEIIVRTSRNFEYLAAQVDLMREVIDWFRKAQYPETMKEPFYLKVPHSGLDILHYFES